MPSLYIPSDHSRWLQRPQHYRLPLLGLPPPLAAGSCSWKACENQPPNRGRYISPLNITKTKVDDHHLEHLKLLKGKYSKPWSTPPKKAKKSRVKRLTLDSQHGTAIAFPQPFRPLFVGIQKRGSPKNISPGDGFVQTIHQTFWPQILSNFCKETLTWNSGCPKKNSWILNKKSSC